MKKTSKNQGPGASGTSKAALTTAIVALPLTMVATLHAQITRGTDQPTAIDQTARSASPTLSVDLCCLKFSERYIKIGSSYTIVGLDDGHTIYQNARNEYFYLDPTSGDMTFVAPETYVKFREGAARQPSTAPLRMWKLSAVKSGGEVTILGVDDAGHVVQRNTRGETFYLDPNTGDMVYVK
jgi:hypothetical protein